MIALNRVSIVRPPRYEEWLSFFFARAEQGKDSWELEWNFDASPDVIADLFTHTMQHCGTDLACFSDESAATGLKAMLMGDSNVSHDMRSASTPRRLTAVTSMKWLYSDVLSKRSPVVLGHLSETADHPLEYVTYMLWDVSPLSQWIGLCNPKSGRSILIETLKDALCLRPASPACIESTLHGFGHFVHSYPKHRQQIIEAVDFFLNHRPITRVELRDYAEAAKSGCVQ